MTHETPVGADLHWLKYREEVRKRVAVEHALEEKIRTSEVIKTMLDAAMREVVDLNHEIALMLDAVQERRIHG